MTQVTLQTLSAYKKTGEKFAVLTAYDASFAQLISEAGVEMLLVGDSLGMVLQGHQTTLPVTVEQMVYHTQLVARGNQNAMVMADMPFMSYSSVETAMSNAALLMQAGANILKLEGGRWLVPTVAALAERGVPVCAHLGLTPQTVNQLGGYRVQGRDEQSAQQMIDDACALVEAGASVLLLECVPTRVAAALTRAVDVPVIGIGAGPDTDAQVLVLHDILNVTPGRKARFVKNYLAGANDIQGAVSQFVAEVKQGQYPGPEHSFE